MAKLTLTDPANLSNEATFISTIAANNAAIEAAMEKTLSRDGTSPNPMTADLDLNNNDLLNGGTIACTELTVNGTSIAASVTAAAASAAAAATSETNAATSETNAATSETNAASYATQASNAIGTRWNFETSTTMGAPAAGGIRLNNATPASVTAIAFSAQDGETGNPDISDYIVTWDDSSSAVKGYVFLRNVTAAGEYFLGQVTSVVDNTTWLQVNVTYVSSSGTFAASDVLAAGFTRAGDKGDAGSMGGPVSSTDNAVVRFDGAGGTTVQNSGVIIDDTNNVTGVVNLTTSGNIELGNASDTTLSRSSAGVLAVEGVTVPLNSTSSVHTASTIELGHATDTTLSRSSAGVLAVEGVTVALNSTSATHTASTIELGAATDTTISRASAGVIAVEGVSLYPGVPVTSKSAAYTVVLGDANTCIYHPSTDNNARTFTIDSNANVAYPVGTFLVFVNEINTVTISITSDTLTLAGSGSTGSRTLAANGVACAYKVASTKWVINGNGLT